MSELPPFHGYSGLVRARRNIMFPKPESEDVCFARSFDACWWVFNRFDERLLKDQYHREHMKAIKQLIGMSESDRIPQPLDRYVAIAQAMSISEKAYFARAVDELASLFEIAFWKAVDRG